MMTVIAVCIVILTLLQLVWTVAIVMTLVQVRKAAVAVENLAVAAKQPVDKVIYVMSKLQDITMLMSGWYKSLWLGIIKGIEMWTKPRHEPERAREGKESSEREEVRS